MVRNPMREEGPFVLKGHDIEGLGVERDVLLSGVGAIDLGV